MRVFLAVTSLLPSYGGPAYSVSRLAIALADCGIHVGLWAPDKSALCTPLLAGDASVERLYGSVAQALNTFGKAEAIHDNGIWMPHNHQLAAEAGKRGIPRMVSTRGMLEPWAFDHKRWKKRLAWLTYQERDLHRAGGLHATAHTEAANLESRALGVPIHVIPNGVDIPEVSVGSQRWSAETDNPVKTALYLGRIYPVKGLPMLVEAWARVRPEGWRLLIAGPDEAGHKAVVEKTIFAAGLDGIVSFVGPVHGETKRTILLDADLFVLPSYSESFGMVVAEALAHSLPVLTTTAVPWPQLSVKRSGWQVAPTVEGLADGLRRATSLDKGELAAMGARGRQFVTAEFSWEQTARKMTATYEELLTAC